MEIKGDPPGSGGEPPECTPYRKPDPDPKPDAGGAAAEPEPEEPDHELMAAPDSPLTAQGPLVDSVADDSDPGGIDFSSLDLRYLSDGSTGAPTRYAFSANAAGPGAAPGNGVAATQRASDAFFVWLSLHPDSFWVNLNPSQPDKVTDPELGKTDVGRVLLDADLDLKRSLARLTQPHTPIGDRFWASPDAVDFLNYCAVTRAWIVPGPAEIREEGDAVYVEKAPLVVQTERGDVGSAAGACTPPPPDVAAREDALTRSVALPEMQREVNEDSRYAPLRQVYYARVAAEWYRERSATRHTEFGNLVDTGDIAPWALHTSWTPQQEFEEYRQSFYQGEYKTQLTIGNKDYTLTQGGIDLSAVQLVRDASPAPAGLAESITRSFDTPTQGPDGRFWLGSVTQVPPPGPPWALIGISSAVVVAALLGSGYWWRRRRRRGQWSGPVTTEDSSLPTFGEPAGVTSSTGFGPDPLRDTSSPGFGPTANSGFGPGSAPGYGPTSTGFGPTDGYRSASADHGPPSDPGFGPRP